MSKQKKLLGKMGLGGSSAAADTLCEENGLPKTIEKLGVDAEASIYVASQRVARAFAVMSGRLTQFLHGEPISIPQNQEAMLMAVWLDGLATGLIAAKQVNHLESQ